MEAIRGGLELLERFARMEHLARVLSATDAARLAAKDHEAMEALRASNYLGSLDSVQSSGENYWCWSPDYGPITFHAPDPADAILKASEAAEKGGTP
jgi:hypothetical protein